MARANQVPIPYVDPNVEHVGITRLRALNVTQLRELNKTGNSGQRQASCRTAQV
jgi:hypothetical protein